MDTNIVFGDFDKDRRCEMVIVSESGFEVQKGFVVIAETLFCRASIVGDVSECVVESSRAVAEIDQLKLFLGCR
jgi:hypothetical protein